MPGALVPVDKLEVLFLVDNATDGLSSVPANVETFASATRRGLRASSGRCLCCAVHGQGKFGRMDEAAG